jgi:hypothetical protein
MSGRIRTRFGLAVVVGLLMSLVGGMSAAYGAPAQKTFTFEVNPAVAADDTDTSFEFEVVNTSANAPLGALSISLPTGFSALSVNSIVTSPAGRNWTGTVSGTTVRLVAQTTNDRLQPGQSLVATVLIHTKDINTVTNDVDEIHTFSAVGRQANNFNDQKGANDVFQQTFTRTIGALIYRDGDGLEQVTLDSNQILLVSGEVADCSGSGPCTATDVQNFTTVTITAPGCNVEGTTLVADATAPFAEVQTGTAVGEAAFFHYLYDPEGAPCPFGSNVDVTILHGKDLKLKANELKVANFYGVDISEYDPYYVGDGVALPSCGADVPSVADPAVVYTTNCLVDITSGSDGITIRLKAVLTPTDPGSVTFR